MNKPWRRKRKRGKGECQLLRGHQFKLVSGQGKWQQWMPKLERSQSDLKKTLLSSACQRSREQGAWEQEPPGQSLVQTSWEGPALWRIFRTSKTTRHLGRQGPGVYRSQLGLFTVCRQTRSWGGPHDAFWLYIHSFTGRCCGAHCFLWRSPFVWVTAATVLILQ